MTILQKTKWISHSRLLCCPFAVAALASAAWQLAFARFGLTWRCTPSGSVEPSSPLTSDFRTMRTKKIPVVCRSVRDISDPKRAGVVQKFFENCTCDSLGSFPEEVSRR